MPERRTIRMGTRGSALALLQTELFADALKSVAPEADVETVVMHTAGDVDKQTPLSILGGQGIFAKELELALLNDQIDVAVHSAKDLTTTLPEGLMLGAVLNRADPRDVLLTTDGSMLADLPAGARVGTSSRRRVMQLRQARPDLRPVDLRGNVDSRLRKLNEGQVDAAIMAAAGIERMGWQDRISEYLPVHAFVPPPGQGALGIECREGDDDVLALLERVNQPAIQLAVETERAFLREVGGGCQSPIGAFATVDGETLTLHAMLADEGMTVACFQHAAGNLAHATAMARELAGNLQRMVQTRLTRTAS